MRVAQPSNILFYLPLYLGISRQDIVTFDGPKQSIRAVIKGHADVAIGDPFLFDFVGYEKHDLCIFAGFANKICHTVITFNPFITKDDSLDELKLVTYPKPSTSWFLGNHLKTSQNIVEQVQTPFNTEIGPLLTQEADLAVVLEPNTTYAKRLGAKELIDFSSMKAVMTGLICTRKYFHSRKKDVLQLLRCIEQGKKLFFKDKKKTLEVAKEYFPLVDEDVLEEAIDAVRKQNPYCKNHRFTKNEVINGLQLRGLIPKSKTFIAKMALD